MINRRSFLKGAAGLMASATLTPKLKGNIGPLGFHNAPAFGIAPETMTLVDGLVPEALSGTLYRNGPAQFRRGEQILDHWFDGDGLVRSFTIQGGQAVLRAQFAQTVKRARDEAAGRFIMPGFGTRAEAGAPVGAPDDANAANTSLMLVGDQLWALWEAGSPYGIDPSDLSTKGPVTLRPDLAQMPFSAHPKVDQDGTIWNFGMAYGSPVTFIWALSPEGKVIKAETVELPMASYLHDWAVSETKLIIPLQPWVFTKRHPPFSESLEWQPEKGLQVLVVDKNDFSNRKLYELPAGAFFHIGAAHEDKDGTVRFDICLADNPTLDATTGAAMVLGKPIDRPEPKLCMVALHPSGKSSITRTPFSAEFPTIDPRTREQKRETVFTVTEGKNTRNIGYRFNAVMAMDWTSQTPQVFDFGPDVLVEEPVFAPDPETQSLGWLLVPALHLTKRVTRLHVFDATRVDQGPVATWQSRHALPLSFHGVWASAT